MEHCPNCLKKISNKAMNKPYMVGSTKIIGVYECPKCKAVLGDCYKGESYMIVKPWFSANEAPLENWRYYDLTVLGGNGIERRHGWFDVTTRTVMQVG